MSSLSDRGASKRIGIDVTAAITQGGGIGRFTRELVKALVEADAKSSYCLFSAKSPPVLPVSNPLPQAANVEYRPAPLNERWLYRFWYRLRLPLNVQWVTGPIDLFHSPDFVLPPVAGNIPTLLTVHDLSFVHYPETFPKPLVDYLSKVVPWSISRATHVLADSISTKRDLTEVWRIRDEKITVMYGGVNSSFRPINDRDRLLKMRAKYGIGAEPYVLSVGTLQPRKNYQMLVKAFRAVAEKNRHNLIIAGGKGWLYDDMLAEVARQGLADRVRFIGFVDDEDMPDLYSDASLFVFPSLYEGFGLPLLEAMACGTPVLTSDASSLPEVVESNADAAIQLSPHDQESWTEAINMLLADPDKCRQLVSAGKQQVRRFSWDRAAAQMLGIYDRLLGTQ